MPGRASSEMNMVVSRAFESVRVLAKVWISLENPWPNMPAKADARNKEIALTEYEVQHDYIN